MSIEDAEHQRLLEMRRGINVPTTTRRDTLEIPSYEEQELNQVPQGDNYRNLPIKLVTKQNAGNGQDYIADAKPRTETDVSNATSVTAKFVQ